MLTAFLGYLCNRTINRFFIAPQQKLVDVVMAGRELPPYPSPHHLGAHRWLRETNGAKAELSAISARFPIITRWDQTWTDDDENKTETIANTYWEACIALQYAPQKFLDIVAKDLRNGILHIHR